jgi:hypothetical protein
MSAAGEAKPSRGPQGAAPHDCGEPDAPALAGWRWSNEAEA